MRASIVSWVDFLASPESQHLGANYILFGEIKVTFLIPEY